MLDPSGSRPVCPVEVDAGFSDAPFVMPDTISRFGGAILEPKRAHHVFTTVVRAFLAEQLLGKAGSLIEVGEQLSEVEVEVVESR